MLLILFSICGIVSHFSYFWSRNLNTFICSPLSFPEVSEFGKDMEGLYIMMIDITMIKVIFII